MFNTSSSKTNQTANQLTQTISGHGVATKRGGAIGSKVFNAPKDWTPLAILGVLGFIVWRVFK